jgi:PAS domain S-box-containing protein
VSSLLENHLIKITFDDRSLRINTGCWEALSCAKVLCPAHGKPSTDCWLIPKTHCANFIEEDFFQKLASCLTCSYFKKQGERHPKGWNYFLSDQIHKYNTKALERIYQKEESFVEILNRIPDGLFTTDHEWRITYFNPAAEKITGFSAYDAVGMYCKDVFKNSVCESDCALKRAIVEGRNIHNREYMITNIEGDSVPIICSTSVFRDGAGRIAGGLEIFKDITELKCLQEEVSKREKKFRRIFEGSHDMIYTTNLQGHLLDVNQAGVDMLGYRSKEDLLSIDSAEKFYRDARDRNNFIELINREGFVKDYEVEFQNQDGSPIHVLISSRRYEDADTGDVEYEGIIKDITRRKQTEEEVRERNRELSILTSLAVALNDVTDLEQLLKFNLENVLNVLRLKRGAIFLIDPVAAKAVLQAKSGLPTPSKSDENHVIFKDKLLKKHLIDVDTYLAPKPTFPSFQVSYRSRSGKPVPWLFGFLITFKGRAVGFFGLDIPNLRVLNRHEIHLIGSLGNFLGGAIENTKLIETIRQHRKELSQLTEKLFESQEEERRRIARELHDEAGQSLTAIKLGLDRMEENHSSDDAHLKQEIIEIRKMIKRTSSEIRRLSYHLHPTLLVDLGLEPALDLYFKEIGNHSSLDIEFNMIGFDQRLAPDMETAFYRFSQEALTNVLKHSGAEKFVLSIIKSYPRIIFQAEDDGIGFDTNIVGQDKRSLGIIGMRERASLLGGSFQLRSQPGRGTRIRIELPYSEETSYE